MHLLGCGSFHIHPAISSGQSPEKKETMQLSCVLVLRPHCPPGSPSQLHSRDHLLFVFYLILFIFFVHFLLGLFLFFLLRATQFESISIDFSKACTSVC